MKALLGRCCSKTHPQWSLSTFGAALLFTAFSAAVLVSHSLAGHVLSSEGLFGALFCSQTAGHAVNKTLDRTHHPNCCPYSITCSVPTVEHGRLVWTCVCIIWSVPSSLCGMPLEATATVTVNSATSTSGQRTIKRARACEHC